MSFIHRISDWVFSVPDGERSAWDIILWWELRRIPYNLIVGAVGICSLILFFTFAGLCAELKPGEDFVEPFAILLAPFGINLGYTAGWIYELFLKVNDPEEAQDIAPELLRSGLQLSLLVVILPSAIWGGICLMKLIGFSRG